MLEVISEGEKPGYSLCKCECGNIKEIANQNLINRQKSCGCIKARNFDNVVRPTGEFHGRWKGGTSSERERIMQTKEYDDWRSKVFERDDFICVKCKVRGYSLNAHHIKAFSESIEERFNIENGITFCKSCHFKFHKLFGRKGTSWIQVQEFINM
jgi:hypothetical protein